MEINIGDIVQMKKSHPCQNDIFKVFRVGMDIKIRCMKCGHEIMLPRAKFEKSVKKFIEKNDNI